MTMVCMALVAIVCLGCASLLIQGNCAAHGGHLISMDDLTKNVS